MQSHIHHHWVLAQGSSLRTDAVYTPSDCFETFPFPTGPLTSLIPIGETYYEHRRQIMRDRQEGLTKTYNRFHDPEQSDVEIERLRDLHMAMDQVVAAAYGWTDLDLDHGFHETKQGLRYTISDLARREVLARLLRLNHERYAQELEQSQDERKPKRRSADATKPKRPRKEKASSRPTGMTLFDSVVDDTAFPATDRDRRLCGLLSDLVAARPSLPATAYLDALVIAERPERYGVFLLDEDRSQFLAITKRPEASPSRSPEALPWADMLQLLTLQEVLHQGAGAILEPGDRFDERRGAFPSCDPLLIQLIHKAAETLRELQGSARAAASDDDEVLSEFDQDKRALGGVSP